MEAIVGLVLLVVVGIVLAIALFSSFFTVSQQTAVPIERFGKFHRIARPGLNLKAPFVERSRRPITLRVQQLDVLAETKTLDNVFVQAQVAVQFRVRDNEPGMRDIETGVYAAAYRLENPKQQIESYVFDTVRSFIPTLVLDDVFTAKNEIADSVQQALVARMAEFGYVIVNTLVPDITPDIKVKNAMNEINASQRLREAAQNKAEANKIMVVKQAEADKESRILQGEGVAGQRKAIAEGLRESLLGVQEANVSSDQSMQVLMATMTLDAYTTIGSSGNSNAIFLPQNPTGMLESIMAGNISTKEMNEALGDERAAQ